MPDREKSQISNFHTDTLNDLLNLQDRTLAQIVTLSEEARKRNRHIRAHLAAHGNEIDYSTVLAGNRNHRGL